MLLLAVPVADGVRRLRRFSPICFRADESERFGVLHDLLEHRSGPAEHIRNRCHRTERYEDTGGAVPDGGDEQHTADLHTSCILCARQERPDSSQPI